MSNRTVFGRAGVSAVTIVVAAGILFFTAGRAAAADVLFPSPLHITRRVEDPLSRSATTIHEYLAGNQVVTVSGDKVAISDYGKQEITEIDRAAGTYSVTRFDALAAATSAVAPPPGRNRIGANAQAGGERWKSMRSTAARPASSRAGEAYEITFTESQGGPAKMEVGFDRNVRVSKAALEVLIGASFPNPRNDVHDALVSVSAQARGRAPLQPMANSAGAAAASSDAVYALPVEQSVTFRVENESFTVRSTVVDVRSELVPPGTVTIPPGAQLVESHAVRLARELREADQLPQAAPLP